MIKQFPVLSTMAAAVLFLATAAYAAAPATQADKTFVAKVSQGGLYEVVASQLAEQRATAPDVKDVAHTEVHDHKLVNSQLKRIATQDGIPVAPTLNAKFRQRLAKLKSVPTAQFDAAYIADMEQIHDGDQKLFAQEAIDGSSSFRTFAHQTDLIVKRHIGALHA